MIVKLRWLEYSYKSWIPDSPGIIGSKTHPTVVLDRKLQFTFGEDESDPALRKWQDVPIVNISEENEDD